jgi:hypothetical protein
MDKEYWVRQEPKVPRYPELEWSRPENRQQAGKLLIIGGNAHGFATPAEAYTIAIKAGIGTARVLLPNAIQKIVGPVLENGEFAASTPSGSFSQQALGEFLDLGAWADGTLLSGELGRNAETAILLEKFLAKHQGAVTITKDAVDYITSAPQTALHRADTLLVLSLSQLQRLGIATHFGLPITFSMDLLHLVDWLHSFTRTFGLYIIVYHLEHILIAVNGMVSSTKTNTENQLWRLEAASKAAVWWLQNPSKAFEAITTSLVI